MRPPLPLVPCLLAVGCTFPIYSAERTLEFTLPAEDLLRLHCETHNGNIQVTGTAGTTQIALRADLSVRGRTQAEADANLALLDVVRERVGDTLRIRGDYPAAELRNRSPGFRFTLTVPADLVVHLTSHNGNVTATGIRGSTTIETHNGSITGDVTTHHIVATTHNGNVKLRLSGDGPLDGDVRSHNGNVEIAVDERLDSQLVATTRNGRVTPPARVQDAALDRRRVSCRLGDGKGKLAVETYNGNVVIR
jgi:DUF4097 and DUF4098 domain-containing protein YvlB